MKALPASLLLVACGPASEPAHSTTVSTPCESCDGDCVDETQEVGRTNAHVAGDVAYEDPPPTSGGHNSCWAQWGLHETDPGDEYWVHNLEHGGVVFLYQPGACASEDCAADAGALEAMLGTEADRRWVIAPYDDLPTAWAAVSWGHRQLMGCFDLGALIAFFEEHVGHGNEDVNGDPPSTCP